MRGAADAAGRPAGAAAAGADAGAGATALREAGRGCSSLPQAIVSAAASTTNAPVLLHLVNRLIML